MDEEKQKLIREDLKAMKNLLKDGGNTVEKSEKQKNTGTDIEDTMETFIPYEELGMYKKG